jgi:hypothetical protein
MVTRLGLDERHEGRMIIELQFPPALLAVRYTLQAYGRTHM